MVGQPYHLSPVMQLGAIALSSSARAECFHTAGHGFDRHSDPPDFQLHVQH